MRTKERAELRGQILEGQYRVDQCIGVGGTGVVFAATRLDAEGPERHVVVKTMRPIFVDNADLRRRLRREAEVAYTVPHPGVVPVIDEGTLSDGSPFIVMERVYGLALNRLLLREGVLPPQEVAAIAMRVAAILHSVHGKGYVHRDVKPEHVLLQQNGRGALEVVLLDFGVCAADTAPLEERDRERGRVFGTPTYVSPEQATGNPDVDARADVYGLGVVMFECLTGRAPFTARNVASLLRRIIREDPPRVALLAPQVDRQLDAVIARAMARDARHRFPSARAFARALAPHAADRWETERELLSRVAQARPLAKGNEEPTLSPKDAAA
ncbi:MAG: serine/threonine-protein kinase [Myxococcota bacterium]